MSQPLPVIGRRRPHAQPVHWYEPYGGQWASLQERFVCGTWRAHDVQSTARTDGGRPSKAGRVATTAALAKA